MKSQEELKKEVKKMRGKMVKFILLFVAVFGITVLLYNMVADQRFHDSEVMKVQCTVTREAVTRQRLKGAIYKVSDCYVEYEGKEYKLNNITRGNSYGYTVGKNVEAYLYKGKMYANKEGIRTSTPVAFVYFLFLGGTVVMLIIMVTSIANYSQAKKALKNFDPEAYDREVYGKESYNKKVYDKEVYDRKVYEKEDHAQESEDIYSIPEDSFR